MLVFGLVLRIDQHLLDKTLCGKDIGHDKRCTSKNKYNYRHTYIYR